jgi:hypothetical protein
MTVNLFGDHPSYNKNIKAMRFAFDHVICLPEVHDGNVVALCFKNAPDLDPNAWPRAPRRSWPPPSCRPSPGSRASGRIAPNNLPTISRGTGPERHHAAPPPAPLPTPPKALDLQTIFSWLLADGIVEKSTVKPHFAQAQGILKNAVGSMHPLTAVAQCKIVSAKPPHRLLTLDVLSEWCAAKVGLPFLRIDPLKIDFTKVADVMSASYAARFNILPVELKGDHAGGGHRRSLPHRVAGRDRAHLAPRIELVLANPLDIAQYISQFFSLAKSIRDANKSSGQDLALRNNFEQLVELGKSNKQFDANDQHIVNIVDWLWSYAFEQRASDIHLEPKREFGVIRFRIDGVLHQVYQVPAVVMIAMTARIKLLGRMDVIEKRRPQDGRIKTDHRRPGSRAAPVDHADRLRRKARDAYLRPGSGRQDPAGTGLPAG